jgi:hypothetical protein
MLHLSPEQFDLRTQGCIGVSDRVRAGPRFLGALPQFFVRSLETLSVALR